jgi:hypothetical protein
MTGAESRAREPSPGFFVYAPQRFGVRVACHRFG